MSTGEHLKKRRRCCYGRTQKKNRIRDARRVARVYFRVSVAVGCLCLRSPLFTISMLQSVMTTVASCTYSIPMRILSMAEFVRVCETMNHNGRRSQTNQNFLRDARYVHEVRNEKWQNIYNCVVTSLWLIIKSTIISAQRNDKTREKENEGNIVAVGQILVRLSSMALSHVAVSKVCGEKKWNRSFPLRPPIDERFRASSHSQPPSFNEGVTLRNLNIHHLPLQPLGGPFFSTWHAPL